MPQADAAITHISDTALMAAACRASETGRPDGLIRDPFAERLAGARGVAIARGLARFEILCFGIGIRSRFLDELVLEAIRERQPNTVVCLGAGLDTRPWRLDLPPTLRWVEVDFPAILEYKSSMLAGETPKCRVERMSADLNSAAGRASVFRAVGDGPAAMITEGLLMYLPGSTVEALASDPGPGIRYWLLDLASAELEQRIGMGMDDAVQRMRADDRLNGDQILETLRSRGWTSTRRLSYITDAWRVAQHRIQAMAAARPPGEPLRPPPSPSDPSGVHLFVRE